MWIIVDYGKLVLKDAEMYEERIIRGWGGNG